MSNDDEFFYKDHTDKLVDTVRISLDDVMNKANEGKDKGLIVPVNINIKGINIKSIINK